MKKVELELFCDEANGDYGFAHKGTIGNDVSFNAFYNKIGLLHDVFEHEHENEKYFRGDAFMNLGGEVAASGAGVYIVELIGSKARSFDNSWNTVDEYMMINNTFREMQDMICNGSSSYGYSLVSNVPKQKTIDSYYSLLEDVIDSHISKVKNLEPDEDNEYPEESLEFKRSITRGKLKNLYRWGYRKAKRRIGDNREMLISFLEFFKKFTSMIEASELYELGIKFMTINWNRNGWRGSIGNYHNTVRLGPNRDPEKVIKRIYKTFDYAY